MLDKNTDKPTPLIKRSYDLRRIALVGLIPLALLLILLLLNHYLRGKPQSQGSQGSAEPSNSSQLLSLSPTPFPTNFDATQIFSQEVNTNASLLDKGERTLMEKFQREIDQLKQAGQPEKANRVAQDALRLFRELERLRGVGKY